STRSGGTVPSPLPRPGRPELPLGMAATVSCCSPLPSSPSPVSSPEPPRPPRPPASVRSPSSNKGPPAPPAPSPLPSLSPSAPLGSVPPLDRKSTRLNSSHVKISYAVFCLKKKKDGNEEDR